MSTNQKHLTPERKARLEADGWKFGDIDELLGLSPEEMQIVETRVRWAASFEAMADDPDVANVEYARFAQAEVMLANP